MAEKTKTLLTALLAAQKAVQPVAKNSTNDFHKYDYASAEDVLTGARKALDEAGLVVIQAGWKLTGENGATKAQVKYEVHHAESGESGSYETELPVLAAAGRPTDKALFGALTEGLAYFLRGLLLIPRADAETPSERDDRNYTPPPAKSKPAAKAAPVAPARAFAQAINALFPDEQPEAIKELITVAGKSVLGDAFDGKWQELDAATLHKIRAEIEMAKAQSDEGKVVS